MTVTDTNDDLTEQRTAVFSDDRAHRYRLTRTWDEALPPLVVIGLNPSTADALFDDPTVRRLRTFAHREQAGGLVLVNIFALRSSEPRALRAAADPIGPHNDEQLRAAMTEGPNIVAAWGRGGKLRKRGSAVCALAAELSITLQCFGHTKDGHPRHPLYLEGTSLLEPLGGER